MATPSKRVVLDYTNRDYKSIRASLVGLALGTMPEWQTVGETGDFGTLLLEMYSYVGDVMNYYVDRVGSEAFLSTAVRRQSVMYIADMLGYSPIGQRSASVPVKLTWEWDTDALPQGLLPEDSYTIVRAQGSNGVVTLSLSGTTSINLVAGQTVAVYGILAVSGQKIPDGSTFVIDDVTTPTEDSPFKAMFSTNIISDWDSDDSEYTLGTDARIASGRFVIIPAKTKLTAANNGSPIVFETDRDVLLDSSTGQYLSGGNTVYRVSATVTAYEGTSVAPTRIGTSQGIPNAEFSLPDAGVIDRSVKVFTREGGQVVEWARVDKMSLASPTQSVFTVYVDDQNYTHVLFGDNASGRIAPANVEIYAEYRFGTGAAANSLGINTITELGDQYATSLGVSVSNTASPVGGADVESIESMRYSVPRAASLKQRAVTLEDFVSLAMQVPGVTKAVAYGANYSTIYVRVASGPQSRGYTTFSVTGKYVDTDNITLTLPSTASSGFYSPYQMVYVDDVFANPISAKTTKVYQKTPGIGISTVEVTSSSGVYTATLTTTSTHGIYSGQPIEVTGLEGALTSLNGIHIATASTATQLAFTTTFSTTGTTVITTGTPSVSRQNGVTFANPPASGADHQDATSMWTAVSGSSTANPVITTVDPTMQSIIGNLEQYLADKKLIGSVVYGEPVEWTDVDVAVFVSVRPLYNREAVRAAVQAAVERVFAYENVDFGKRISIGDVYRAGLSIEGVSYITLTKMDDTGGTAVQDVNVSDDDTLPNNDPDNAYRIPRINTTAVAWVTATGGLANT